MGDHYSSPRVFNDPAADIADLYAFPSPDRPGHVVLVLTVFPSATPASLFSDAITYRFRIRPVTITGTSYTVSENEHTFDFTFAGDGPQTGTCTTPSGAEVPFLVGAGQREEAAHYSARAAARYDQLASRHPEAFAGHAADFRASVMTEAATGPHLLGCAGTTSRHRHFTASDW